MPKKTIVEKLVNFADRHPIIFWGGAIAWILLPAPVDFIPVVDDIILAVMLSLVGIEKLK